jgi:hypothetical protein
MILHPEVAARWPTADAFYGERDDRTAREVENLARYVHRAVEIHVHPSGAAELPTQQIAVLAANLMARWARRIRVIVPDVELHPLLRINGWTRLPERIEGEMHAADPFGDFRTGPTGESAADEVPLRLFVGPWTPGVGRRGPEPDNYVVDAAGWSAIGCRGGSALLKPGRLATVAAAALAAAIGVGEVFKRAVGHPRHQWVGDLTWCTWSHSMVTCVLEDVESGRPAIPEVLDLGRLLLAGVGAIGSAVLYILAGARLSGSIILLDRDRVETSNLNRSPLFTALDAARELEKIEVGRRLMERIGIPTELRAGTWHEHGATLAGEGLDTWISLTNEEGAWAEIPFQMPPIVLHGTTTSGWGFGAGRHIPRLEDCTLCRLPHPAQEFRGRCAEAQLETAAVAPRVSASLPFLSVAAAALIVAELIKLPSEHLPELPNDVSADFRVGLPAVIATHRLHDLSCRGCRALTLSSWERFGGRGRFSHWSRLTSTQGSVA